MLGMIRSKPYHPLVFIMGGAKADIKLKLVKEFLNRSEAILLGGILANTLFYAKGLNIGKSFVEEKLLVEAKILILFLKIYFYQLMFLFLNL